MPNSPNLQIPHVDPAQSQKTVTLNYAIDALDLAIAGHLVKSVAGSSDYTLTTTPVGTAESENMVLEMTGAMTADINIIVPTQNKLYIAYNNTTGGHTLTFKTVAGT